MTNATKRTLAASMVVCGAMLTGGCALRSSGAESLGSYIEKVRHVSVNVAAVKRMNMAPTLESVDPDLAAALLQLTAGPTADRHRAVAEIYERRGVTDAAYRHFNAAVALDPRNAAAFDGLARIWRDWGLPRLAVPDAQRALFYAPDSAPAHNTFGTILQALGQFRAARTEYERARQLDPMAAYAVNNLCYLSFTEGRLDQAIDACTAALAVDPMFRTARNNLGLAYAASGRLDLAEAEFMHAGHSAQGFYNMGIVHLAGRDYARAAAAFDAASRQRPTFAAARERAREARDRAAREPRGGVQ